MLTSLHIENVAVVKSVDIDFNSGFSALTGESITELFECVAIAASEYASKNSQPQEAPRQAKQTKESSCC